MTRDWRWKLAILIFSLVPTFGIGKYIEHYQIQNSETEVTVSDLGVKVTKNLTQLQINDLDPECVQMAENGKYQYAVVTSPDSESPTGTPLIVVLQRRKLNAGISLNAQLESGVVRGLVSSSQRLPKERLVAMGISLPASTPERLLYVDVDREYLSGIVRVTTAFAFLGLGVLFMVYTKLEEQQTTLQNQRSRVNGQVALALAIARQETYHR